MQLHQQIFWSVTSAAYLYAFIKGGAPERLVAALLLVASLVPPALLPPLPGIYGNLQLAVFASDILLLTALVAVALLSCRFWPMLVVAFHAQSVLAHLARTIAPGTLPVAYYVLTAWWCYPITAALIAAVYLHRRRLLHYGLDPAWTFQLSAEYRGGALAREAPGTNLR